MSFDEELTKYKLALVDAVKWLDWYYPNGFLFCVPPGRVEKLKENAEWQRRYHFARFGVALGVS